MALSLKIKSDIGQEFSNAYLRIDEYSCNKEEVINARIRAYISRELMKEGANYISGTDDIISFKADYSDNAENTKKQIYEHIKTLDKYKNAIDVLE